MPYCCVDGNILQIYNKQTKFIHCENCFPTTLRRLNFPLQARLKLSICIHLLYSLCSLSYDRSIVSSSSSSSASSAHSAIQCFFFQFPVSSLFIQVIQQLHSLIPRLSVTFILPITFPSITCSRRQFRYDQLSQSFFYLWYAGQIYAV